MNNMNTASFDAAQSISMHLMASNTAHPRSRASSFSTQKDGVGGGSGVGLDGDRESGTTRRPSTNTQSPNTAGSPTTAVGGSGSHGFDNKKGGGKKGDEDSPPPSRNSQLEEIDDIAFMSVGSPIRLENHDPAASSDDGREEDPLGDKNVAHGQSSGNSLSQSMRQSAAFFCSASSSHGKALGGGGGEGENNNMSSSPTHGPDDFEYHEDEPEHRYATLKVRDGNASNADVSNAEQSTGCRFSLHDTYACIEWTNDNCGEPICLPYRKMKKIDLQSSNGFGYSMTFHGDDLELLFTMEDTDLPTFREFVMEIFERHKIYRMKIEDMHFAKKHKLSPSTVTSPTSGPRSPSSTSLQSKNAGGGGGGESQSVEVPNLKGDAFLEEPHLPSKVSTLLMGYTSPLAKRKLPVFVKGKVCTAPIQKQPPIPPPTSHPSPKPLESPAKRAGGGLKPLDLSPGSPTGLRTPNSMMMDDGGDMSPALSISVRGKNPMLLSPMSKGGLTPLSKNL